MTVKGKGGAPKGSGLKYTAEQADLLCAALESGKTLSEHCREVGISRNTVYLWRDAFPEFAVRLARARDIGEEVIAEECLSIANTPLTGTVETEKPDGSVERRREDMLGHRKLQIETRLKLLKIWNPKKYGDRITHAGDPDAPVALQLNGSDVHG